MARGLSDQQAAALVACRGEAPFTSLEELWQRAGISTAALERLAEADAFGGMGLARRAALWAIRGVADSVLPLFEATDRGRAPEPEATEPAVALPPMSAGREVVADYGSTGLRLRAYPISFLHEELRARSMATCADLLRTRDGRRVVVPGIRLMRRKPGSAKGVMFLTLENETGIANLILWPLVLERQRPVVLSASMLACHGRLQCEGEVLHVITERLQDLSDLLRSVRQRSEAFPVPIGRGDGVRHGSPDQRHQP